MRSLVQNVAALDQQRAAAADAGVLRDDSAPLRSAGNCRLPTHRLIFDLG